MSKNTSYLHFCCTCSYWTKLMKWMLLKLAVLSSAVELMLDTTPLPLKGKKDALRKKKKIASKCEWFDKLPCFRRDETSADVSMNFASFLREWVSEYCMVAFLGEEGDYRCLSRQKGSWAAWKGLCFKRRRRTDSYLSLFTCRLVSPLIMWVRENPSHM